MKFEPRTNYAHLLKAPPEPPSLAESFERAAWRGAGKACAWLWVLATAYVVLRVLWELATALWELARGRCLTGAPW